MSVSIDLNLGIKCDKCGKTATNHYVIDDLYLDVEWELEKLVELNSWFMDGDIYCEDCSED